ncbi:MAG: DUF559 domain-containing protein [Allobranchiibius sp.]
MSTSERIVSTPLSLPLPGCGRRKFRAEATRQLAELQDGVCSRTQLRALGVTRDDVRHEVAAGRWGIAGAQTVQLSTGGATASWRSAIWETRGDARLDGVTALLVAGLTGWNEDVVHLSVMAGSRVRPVPGVHIHQLRSRENDVVGDPPRTSIDWAALRAASWASSDRAATTLLAMVVQQRLTTAARLRRLLEEAPAIHRVAHLRVVVRDIAGGAQALSEIDFARLCRQHGLPEPSRQVPRSGPGGRIYLDAEWPTYGVVVEIDGSQHRAGLATVSDALRDNHLTIHGSRVLRIPVLGLRVEPEAFLAQLGEALRRGGWS